MSPLRGAQTRERSESVSREPTLKGHMEDV
jgi:hypothetical protein